MVGGLVERKRRLELKWMFPDTHFNQEGEAEI